MIDIKERIKKVLEQGYLLSLGTIDEGGPWVSDVIYISDDDFNLYWMSNTKFRHSEAIEKNNNVAGTITVSQKPGVLDFGLQIKGTSKKLEGLNLTLIAKYLKKKGKVVPDKVIDILLGGYAWYQMKPTTIELIDQENYNFDKKKIDLNN